ncbi:MAG: histidine phosphatase family protein [Lachnospiraceae bacterium]|nr:histidine phosphatase family protein [Lachnospiraceae bacterium]
MRITIIRHGKVNMEWPKKCSSIDFDMACAEYDRSDLEGINITPICEDADKIYVSTLPRSVHTAEILFPNRKYYEMPEIGEVPLRSFMDTEKRLPLWMWNILGRVQWYIGSSRQLEKRNSTIQRANKVIDLCESQNKDCILVTHGFFMKTLIRVLKKRKYQLSGNNQFTIKNLQLIYAENFY